MLKRRHLTPCGIPPVEARSALDNELLRTSPDDPTDPVDGPRDGSGDHTVPPHHDLTQSWREFWEAQDFKFSGPQ